MIYEILTDAMEKLEKELKKIERKCNKYGCPFEYKIIGTTNKMINKNYYDFTIVELSGMAIINDYELIGIINRVDNKNIVNSVNGSEVPKRFWNTENYCEHCNSKRNRNTLFILRNTKTNEYKQVGKSCVKLYTNGIDAEHFARLYMYGNLFKEYSDLGYEYIDTYSVSPKYKVDDVLNVAIMLIDELGYMNSNDELSTKLLIQFCLGFDLGVMNRKLKGIYEFTDKELNTDRSTKINNIKEYYLNIKAKNDYEHNIQVLLANEYINMNMVGYLAYLPKGYDKVIEKQRKLEKKLSDTKDAIYYGIENKRYKQINVKDCSLVGNYSTVYGITNVYQIIVDNSVLIWKTTNSIDIDNVNKIDFTVKEHRLYNGIKQTSVTRCKVY